jgi:hypothetical protein
MPDAHRRCAQAGAGGAVIAIRTEETYPVSDSLWKSGPQQGRGARPHCRPGSRRCGALRLHKPIGGATGDTEEEAARTER